MAIVIRAAETDTDLEAWRQVRIAVLLNERCLSIAEMRAMATPETLYVVAEIDGRLAGSGLAGRSSFDYAGLHPRVLSEACRHGVGTALLHRLADHAHACGFTEAGTLVDDAGSMSFAERFGTCTQIGSDSMRALNERLGYVERGASITVRGPIPLRGART